MVDQKKRTTLKTLSAAAAVAATPSALAAGAFAVTGGSSDAPLNITVNGDGTAVISNSSSQPVSLRHVSPGRVTANSVTFDLNELVTNGPLEIDAGTAHRFQLKPVAANAEESAMPQAVIAPQMAQVTTPYQSTVGELTSTTRRMIIV